MTKYEVYHCIQGLLRMEKIYWKENRKFVAPTTPYMTHCTKEKYLFIINIDTAFERMNLSYIARGVKLAYNFLLGTSKLPLL